MSPVEIWENAEPGVRRKVFQPGQSLMMMEVHFAQGAKGYEHSHPHEQMTFCVKGRFEFTINGETHRIVAGETVQIPSNALHSAEALEEGILLDCFTPIREDLL